MLTCTDSQGKKQVQHAELKESQEEYLWAPKDAHPCGHPPGGASASQAAHPIPMYIVE